MGISQHHVERPRRRLGTQNLDYARRPVRFWKGQQSAFAQRQEYMGGWSQSTSRRNLQQRMRSEDKPGLPTIRIAFCLFNCS